VLSHYYFRENTEEMDTNDALNSRENSSEDETGSDEDKNDIVSCIRCVSIKMSSLPTDLISV